MSDSIERVGEARPLNPETFARYAVRDRMEIIQLLRALADKRLLVTAYVDEAASFVTVVLALEPNAETLILDASPDEALNRRALDAPHLTCMTRLDNVRIQFALVPLAAIRYEDGAALRARLPTSVLRLQRREFFRLTAPQWASLTCDITLGQADGTGRTVSAQILDISGGGLAIFVPPQDLTLEAGMKFDDCRLVLPDGEPLPVRLAVRNLFDIERANGTRARRAGCEFIGLSSAITARLQRYILRLQRDRNALTRNSSTDA